jgi:zinc protease
MVKGWIAAAMTIVGLALGLGPAAPAAAADWPPHSDVAPDPAVRFGVLPNGMDYAIMKNATPKGVVSIRFRIGAGSLEERDDQQGLAHFLEHMAFRGSTHVPEAEVWRDLQRLGMTVGADANANTGFEQTVFAFDLPTNDADTVAAGLMRMRETASELTLSQTAMDAERGVVLSEMRMGDVPNFHAQKANYGFVLEGQRLPTRFPIGKADVLQHAPVGLIADFYHAYYRPDRATLIVVGDVDPDAIEAQIKARFSDWKPVGPVGPDPALGAPLVRGPQTRLFVEPGVQPAVILAWTKPYDPAVESQAKDRRETLEAIGLSALNYRFQVAASRPDRSFLGAQALQHDTVHSAKLAELAINPTPDQDAASLTAAETIRRQIVEYGVRQDEVDRVVAAMGAALETNLAGAATRRSPPLAGSLLGSADAGNDIPTSPAQNLAAFQKFTAGLTATEVTAALRQVFSGGGPLLFVSSPKPVDGGEAGLGAALAAADAAPIKAAAAEARIAWPYASFGAPGKVVSRTEIADLGVTMVNFANGVQLAVKPTRYAVDQVLVGVSMGHGLEDMPKTQKPMNWAMPAFTLGGLRAISVEDMQRTLAGKIYSPAAIVMGEDRSVMAGATKTEDLDIQMQVLTAYLTAPGWRPQAFDRIRANYIAGLPQLEVSPQGVVGRQLGLLLHDGDQRWVVANAQDASAARVEDLEAALSNALAKGPLRVFIVGDLTVDQAIAATAATFGALPPRPAAPALPPEASEVHFPPPTASPVVLRHKGRADKAMALIAWPTTDFYANVKQTRALDLLVRVVQQRLVEQLRIAEGASYSPSATLVSSQWFPGYGDLQVFAELPPVKVALFYDTLARIVGDLRANPISADELQRARGPLIQELVQAQQTNAYWMAQISNDQVDPRSIDAVRSLVPDLNGVTPADLQSLARTYLKDDTAWKLVALPEGAAP